MDWHFFILSCLSLDSLNTKVILSPSLMQYIEPGTPPEESNSLRSGRSTPGAAPALQRRRPLRGRPFDLFLA
uniref:Uncharacterized protein n=1 Tax=Cyprinus carpio carpio TaxID=630221 RepID=A0A9J8DE50_CYPCA